MIKGVGRFEKEASRISAEEVAAAYAEELFNTPEAWSFILDGQPTIKEKVISFFTGAPSRYSFAPEIDPAARKWLKEYKKLFDEVARFNAGASAAENIGADNRVLKVIGKVVDDSTGTETRVPDKVVKKVGKIVDDNTLEPQNNTFGSYNNETGTSNNVKTTNEKSLTRINEKTCTIAVRGGRYIILTFLNQTLKRI